MLSDQDQDVSRWEPDTLTHRKYTDKYEEWLESRRAEHRAETGGASLRATGRFRRSNPSKSPWEPIPVKLRGEDL